MQDNDLTVVISSTYRSKWVANRRPENGNIGGFVNEQMLPQQHTIPHPPAHGMYSTAGYGINPNTPHGTQQFRHINNFGVPQMPQHMPRGPIWARCYQQGDQGVMPGHGQGSMVPQPSTLQSPRKAQVSKHKSSKEKLKQDDKESTAGKKSVKPLECSAQSKPPSEEALEDDMPLENERPGTPSSQGSHNSNSSKVKVSLPMVSPPRFAQGKMSKKAKEAKPADHPPTSTVREDALPKKEECKENASIKVTKPSNEGPKDTFSKAPMAVTKGCETAVVSKTTATGEHSRAPSILTEEEKSSRQQAWIRIPVPLDPRKAKKITPTKSKSGNVAKDKVAPSERLEPRTCSEVSEAGKEAPDAEIMSVKSVGSKTMSVSSTTSNISPQGNYTKTPFNSETKRGSHTRHDSQVSQSSDSPVKNNARNSKNQNRNHQA